MSETSNCIRCGRPVEPNVLFCPHCGASQTQAVPPVPPTPAAPPPGYAPPSGTGAAVPPPGYGPAPGMGAAVPPRPSAYAPTYPPVAPAKSKTPVILIVLGVGCVGMVFFVAVLGAILFPVFAQAREKARTMVCLSNVKKMSTGVLMYAQDYDEVLPKASVWMDKIGPYMTQVRSDSLGVAGADYHCPSVLPRSPDTFGYAYFSKLSNASMGRISDPRSTQMIYDSSNPRRNASDSMTSVPNPPRHGGHKGNVFAYVDGHAKYVISGLGSALDQQPAEGQ